MSRAAVVACAACVAAAYGDRAFNWAVVGLMAMPFLVAATVAAVLVGCHRGRRPAERGDGPGPESG